MSITNVRLCPFDGCTAMIPADRFGCRRHWYSLSKPHRDAIWEAYRLWQLAEISGDELRARQQAVLDEHYGRARS